MAEVNPYGDPKNWIRPSNVEEAVKHGMDPVTANFVADLASGKSFGDVSELLPSGETRSIPPERLQGDGPRILGERE